MTPENAIAMLDRQIARHGQPIKLRRGLKDAPAALLPIAAFVRGYKPSEIISGSGISQKDSLVIVSPSALAEWPNPFPKEGDWCEIDGQYRAIIADTVITISDTPVRIELQVQG